MKCERRLTPVRSLVLVFCIRMVLCTYWRVFSQYVNSPNMVCLLHSTREPVCTLGAQAWERMPGNTFAHCSRTRSLNPCCKMECWYLITSINLGGISSLESGPPVSGKIKSYVCRKYYTRLPQGKIFISPPVSPLYVGYLSGVNSVSAYLKYIILKWELDFFTVKKKFR